MSLYHLENFKLIPQVHQIDFTHIAMTFLFVEIASAAILIVAVTVTVVFLRRAGLGVTVSPNLAVNCKQYFALAPRYQGYMRSVPAVAGFIFLSQWTK